MELNWFTVIAQIVNFLILVWLMKKFLYGPIVSAMQEREDKIRARLENAEDREKEAESEKKQFQEKQQDLDQNKEKILSQTKEEAEQKKKEMWEQARTEVDDQKQKWLVSIEHEKEEFLKQLRQSMYQKFSDALRKALGDLANQELEQCVISVFLSKLQNLDEEAKQSLSKSAAEENAEPTVRSAFEIPEEKKGQITDAIKQAISQDIQIEFESSETLITGIEFRAGGRKIAWNAESYVQDIQQELSDGLKKQIERGKQQKQKPQEGQKETAEETPPEQTPEETPKKEQTDQEPQQAPESEDKDGQQDE